MQDIHLQDETFDPNQTHHYRLFIQLGKAELSYCLLNTVNQKFVLLHHYHMSQTQTNDQIAHFINSDPVFRASYKKVSVLVTGGKNTLVPIPFFTEEDAPKWASLSMAIPASEPVFTSPILRFDAVTIFTNDEITLCNLIAEIQPAVKVYHRTTSLLNYMATWPSHGLKYDCFISVTQKFVDIGVVQNHQLDFFNSFEYVEVSDVVYFILKALQPYPNHSKQLKVYISTDISNQNELFDLLNNYLPDIRFIKPSDQFVYSYLFDDMHLTRYANLFNLALCE